MFSSSPPPLTYSVLTPRGRGAVAVVKIGGEFDTVCEKLYRSANDKPLSDQPLKRIWFGHWGETTPEEVVLTRIAENQWECCCHGGEAAVRRICRDLERLGAVELTSELNGESSQSVLEQEYRDALTRTTTWNTTRTLLKHPTQGWIAELTGWEKKLTSGDQTNESRAAWQRQIEQILEWSRFGLHLTEPWKVVLLGEPNSGKSSLLNRLAGFERAIVHEQPGTTRDLVTVNCAFQGWPISLIDTAGIREDAELIEMLGIERAKQMIARADLVLWLHDVSQSLSRGEQQLAELMETALRIDHKCDLIRNPQIALDESALAVSAKTGAGLDELIEAILTRLIPRQPDSETIFPVTPRQIELLNRLSKALEGDRIAEAISSLKQLLGDVDSERVA